MSKYNKIEDLIIMELRENEFVSGDEFYELISRKLSKYKNELNHEIFKELERLFQEGKIIRYELRYPEDFSTKRKVDKFPRYQYTLFK